MKHLVVIPARGGSKGLPGKNIKKLNGIPLIHHTIQQARNVFADDEIVISTDDEEIKMVAEQTGINVPFLRPAHLATDVAGTHEVLMHALQYYEERFGAADVVVLLQVTSPLRKAEQIREALSLYNANIDLVVSVKESDANPYYVLFEENTEGFLKKSKEGTFIRRQDCPKVWELNGAIYIINPQHLRNRSIMDSEKIIKYKMDKRSSIDIDDEIDFMVAEKLVENENL